MILASETKTVTRTERYVHESEQGPIVDERVVTTVYKGEEPVDHKVDERTTSMNDFEEERWHSQEEVPIDDELVTNSRQAMFSTREERTDDGIVTTTTFTTSHVVPEPEIRDSVIEAETPTSLPVSEDRPESAGQF